MRKFFIFTFTILCLVIKAQESPYYFYNYDGQKVYLSLNTEHAFISTKEKQLPVNIQQLRNTVAELQSDKSDQKHYQNKKGTNRFYTILNFEEIMSDEQYLNLLSDIKHQNGDVIISPFFKIKDDDIVGLSNFFYVKLKEESDTTILRQMTFNTGTIIIEQDPFMPLWYVLSTTDFSVFNAMECANFFYESGLFQAAEPNLMLNLLQCVNDTHFANQWGLKNTGQYKGTSGIDIKACEAWQISRGNNVTVAVIDHGIELDHPDLESNIHTLSYDCGNRTSPSTVRGNHGTACAGIIGAVQDNSVGISGVAPNCRLMSISNSMAIDTDPDSPNFNILQQQNLANGIDWARQNGADVISCSWGHNLLQGAFITDAINNAITNGRRRDGKNLGCVIVFSSGNDNASSVGYPASLSNVIAVGAISNCGKRKSPSSCDTETSWGSNYGNMLDVVAPGVLIPTTDRQDNAGYNPNTRIHPNCGGTKINTDYADRNYTVWFNGTSAACPHVSGIAALILSVNPTLKMRDVRNIIESTAQKIGGYKYKTETGRNNGTWNNEMGYGLVNAYDAVQKAVTCATTTVNFVNKPPIISDTTITSCGNIYIQNVTITNNAILTLDASGNIYILDDVKIENGAKLVLDAAGKVVFGSGFKVELGSKLEIK